MILLVPTALAGKGGGAATATGSSTATVSPAGPYVFGESVYVTTDAPIYPNGMGPYISLTCYQNGVMVLSGSHAAFSTGWYYNWPFNLGPTLKWKSGPAECTARVFHMSNNKNVTDALTSFHVDG